MDAQNRTKPFHVKFHDGFLYIFPYLACSMCCFGILVNILFVLILSQRPLRTLINLILSIIAVVDAMMLMSMLIYNLHFYILVDICDPNMFSHNWAVFSLFHANFSVTLYGLGVWFTVVLAALRYHIVRQTHIYVLTPRLVLSCMIPTMILVFVFNIPTYLSYGIDSEFRTVDNGTCRDYFGDGPTPNYTSYYVGPTEFAIERQIMTYAHWISAALFKVGPCILLSVFITLLLAIMSRKRQNEYRLQRHSSNFQTPRNYVPATPTATTGARMSMTAVPMLTAATLKSCYRMAGGTSLALQTVLIIFIVTQFPQGICLFYVGFRGEYNPYIPNIYQSFSELFEILSVFNSSINFVIYCLISSQFRQCVKMFFTRQETLPSTTRRAHSQSERWITPTSEQQILLRGRGRRQTTFL